MLKLHVLHTLETTLAVSEEVEVPGDTNRTLWPTTPAHVWGTFPKSTKR